MILDVQDIINSVSVPALIKDNFIRQGSFVQLKNGDLQAYVGGFSIVFPVEVHGEKWAFRCWHRTLDDAIERIKLLSGELKRVNLPFLLDFEFVQSGIVVGGRSYPTTRMKWVDGITIKEYIISNCRFQSKLLKLADQFLHMTKDMHKHSFAHGDLQHGNIIVNEHGEIILVDYDSFYCPKLAGEQDIITGLKDYQHPVRKSNKVTSEKIDYFSELIIYTSILGIAYNPSLAEKYKVEDTEHMLFESKDFGDIKHSTIYKDLKDLNPIFPILLGILEIYLSKNTIDDLEPFDVIMERMTKAPVIMSFKSSPSNDLYVGDKIKLSWLVEGEADFYLDGKSIKSSCCERTLSKVGKNNYTLKAANEFKESKKSLEIAAYAIPNLQITASNCNLHRNSEEETVIEWSVDNSYEVFLCYDGLNIKIESRGNMKLHPQETTTYTLKVIGLDKKRVFEKEVTVGVYSPAEVSFVSDTNVVLSKKPVTLSWSVENAIKVELQGVGVVTNKGEKVMCPEKDALYMLTVTDAFGSKDYSLNVKTLPLPVIKFKTDKKKINKDREEKAIITWDVQNASNISLELNGKQESVKEKGSKDIQLTESTKILLKCIALDSKTFFEEFLDISVFNEAKISFSSDRKYTIPEVPVVLSWNVENSNNVELKGYGTVSPQGSKQVKAKAETVYTLVVTDEFTTQEKSLVVKMLPLPMVKSISVPMPELNKPLNVTINVPKPETQFKFPQISIPFVNFRVPDFPDMNGIFDYISKNTRPSFLSEIKSLFSHYFCK